MSQQNVVVMLRANFIVVACGNQEIKMAGVPGTEAEFEAALERVGEWAFQRGQQAAADRHAAFGAERERRDRQLLDEIRRLVARKKGGRS